MKKLFRCRGNVVSLLSDCKEYAIRNLSQIAIWDKKSVGFDIKILSRVLTAIAIVLALIDNRCWGERAYNIPIPRQAFKMFDATLLIFEGI